MVRTQHLDSLATFFSEVKASFFTATSTATSTFPVLYSATSTTGTSTITGTLSVGGQSTFAQKLNTTVTGDQITFQSNSAKIGSTMEVSILILYLLGKLLLL